MCLTLNKLIHIYYSTFRSPLDVPEVKIPEDLAVNIALALRADINRALGLFREIALGHDLMKFLGVNLYSKDHIHSFFSPV